MNKRKLAKVMNCNISLTIKEKTIFIEIIKGKLYFNGIMFLSEFTFKYRRRFFRNGKEIINPFQKSVADFIISKFNDKCLRFNSDITTINECANVTAEPEAFVSSFNYKYI
jgi:hypothetical protein